MFSRRRHRVRERVFCSGTPPRSEGGACGLRAPLPSAREAAPLQKGKCIAARRPNPRIPECIAAAFCSGTPPRSEGGAVGCGPYSRRRGKPRRYKKANASPRGGRIHECIAATYFVAERLRVPRGGAASCGLHSRRRGKPRRYKKANASPRRGRIHECIAATYFVAERLRVPRGCGGLRAPLPSAREAAPLQKGECIAAQRPNPRIPECIAPAFCSGTPPRSEGGGVRAAGPTPVGAGSRAATERRMHRRAEAESTNPRMHRRHVFCSGTPPRSDRGGGGLRAILPSAREAAPLQKGECIAARRPNPRIPECIAATYFVAERLRVPTGGAVGCGPYSRRRGEPRRYKKANASPPHLVAERLRVPTGGVRAAGPAPVGAGSRAATKRRMHRRAEAESTIFSSFPRRPRSRPGAWTSARKVPRASCRWEFPTPNHVHPAGRVSRSCRWPGIGHIGAFIRPRPGWRNW